MLAFYFPETSILQAADNFMLTWTETEEGFEIDQKPIDQFNAETSDGEFEKKITVLLRPAFDADVNDNAGATF
jgi:hypothetical protein